MSVVEWGFPWDRSKFRVYSYPACLPAARRMHVCNVVVVRMLDA